jgi:hypothetical protein
MKKIDVFIEIIATIIVLFFIIALAYFIIISGNEMYEINEKARLNIEYCKQYYDTPLSHVPLRCYD